MSPTKSWRQLLADPGKKALRVEHARALAEAGDPHGETLRLAEAIRRANAKNQGMIAAKLTLRFVSESIRLLPALAQRSKADTVIFGGYTLSLTISTISRWIVTGFERLEPWRCFNKPTE